MRNCLSTYIIIMLLATVIGCHMVIPEDNFNMRHSMSEGDSLHLYSTLDEAYGTRFDEEKTYYSMRFGKMRTLQGAIDGEPLQGEYELFYKKRPIQKGKFRNGLKNGRWFTWSNQGILLSIVDYQMGIKHGEIREFDENGSLNFVANNKKGNLDGVAKFIKGNDQTFVKYKDGIVIDTLASKPSVFKLLKKDKELSEE